MKKIIILTIIILLACFGVFLFLWRNDNFTSASLHRPKQVIGGDDYQFLTHSSEELIIFSFQNYAWLPTYYGEIIFEDGERYAFDCNETKDLTAGECLTKRIGKITNTDLKKLKEIGSELDEDLSMKNTANDFGEVSITYRYQERTILLVGRGDNEIINSNDGSKKILKILRKYDIYV